MESKSIKEKIGQMFMAGFPGTSVPGEVETFIEGHNIGFVILFSRNIDSPGQVLRLTNHLHSLAPVCPAIFCDQEGGLVVRFGEHAATAISHMGLAATGDPGYAREAGEIIARDMKNLGLDGVFAPVLDVNLEEDNPVIGIRAFSDDPARVVLYAREFAAGLNQGGTAACGKHFPGHGCTTRDSHLEVPACDISPEYFSRFCLGPFLAMARGSIDSLMSSHVLFPRISGSIATFAPGLVQEHLRQKTRYRGVIFSDCLEMDAVKKNFSAEEIALQAVGAGIDVLSVSHELGFQKEIFDCLLFHVQKGSIPEKRIDESYSRIMKLKEKLDLTGDRNKISPQAADKTRIYLDREREIANRSITLLRNRDGVLPMDRDKKCLLLEWRKETAGPDLSDQVKEPDSALGQTGRAFLPLLETRILKTGQKLPEELKNQLKDYKYIIACPFSLNPGSAREQAVAINELLEYRDDLIVAALGNPYDIKYFPGVGHYLASYGSRMVQREALFKVLTGEVNPSGRLPVEIRGIFPRDFGLDYTPR